MKELYKLLPQELKNWVDVFYKLTPAYKKKALISQKLLEERNKRIKTIMMKLFPEGAARVLNGPFMGMAYLHESNGSQLLPKIIGSYEEPIHRWITEICTSDEYKTIINVGCAEGYYACGFASKLPIANVYAYDIDKNALLNAKLLSQVNGLKNIVFAEAFNDRELHSIINSTKPYKVLIFMDVEGAELTLLDPKISPGLAFTDILVELHDCYVPGITEKMIEFFFDTHEIELTVDYTWRDAAYTNINDANLTVDDMQLMMNEFRPSKMRWMYAKARLRTKDEF